MFNILLPIIYRLRNRTEIWKSEVRIRVQIRIFLLKSKIVISQGIRNKFVSNYQIDLEHRNKEDS
jgi:hypothetical protein